MQVILLHVLTENCLSHKTAVAAAALSQYLRFLLEPEGETLYDVLSADLTLRNANGLLLRANLVDTAENGDNYGNKIQSKLLENVDSNETKLRKRKEVQVKAERKSQILYDYYDVSNQSRVLSRTDTVSIAASTVLQAHLSVLIFLLPVMFFLYQCLKRFRVVIRYTLRTC